jgi:hypothetical protein
MSTARQQQIDAIVAENAGAERAIGCFFGGEAQHAPTQPGLVWDGG